MTGGAALVVDEEDLLERASLLMRHLDMGQELLQFSNQLRIDFSPSERSRWLANCNSSNALACIQRFAAIEGDTRIPGSKGLGRMSAKTWPRLGGTLAPEVARRGVSPEVLIKGVEQTVQASYLVALGFTNILDHSVAVRSEDELWTKWIPCAYLQPPDVLGEALFGAAAFQEYWRRLFENYGLRKAARSCGRSLSSVGRSIIGLALTGGWLALVERPPN